MMIVGALMLMAKVAFAVGCVVGSIMIFPTWYGVCETIQGILEEALWLDGGMPALIDFLFTLFPYLSVFLIGLGVYIGFIKLMGKASSDNEVL